jgi:hypothetical protein
LQAIIAELYVFVFNSLFLDIIIIRITVSKLDYLKRRETMDMKYLKITVSLLLIICLCGIANAGAGGKESGNTKLSDNTEGGHQDTDFNSGFMSEW